MNTKEPVHRERLIDINLSDIPSLRPGLSVSAHIGLTLTYTAVFSALFIFIYVQLWLIWWYRHKRFSYQTVFLFLCLFWAGLRTTLFSFYYKNCVLANNLPIMLYWLLYCFPVTIQFMTLVLLLEFFAQVVFKARAKHEPHRFRKPLRVAAASSVILFLVTSVVCAVKVKYQERVYKSVPLTVLTVRVAINDTLFLLCAIALCYCFIKIARLPASHVVMEAKGMTVCRSIFTCAIVIFLYSTRAVYNFIAIYPNLIRVIPNFGYGWVNVSDQADIFDLESGYAFVSFGIVLFVWEVLPTSLVVFFFRVKRPSTPTLTFSDVSSQGQSIKSYFFDNPRRYDSDDDLVKSEPRGFLKPSNVTSSETPPLSPGRGHFIVDSYSGYGPHRLSIPGSPLYMNSARTERFSQKSNRVTSSVLVHDSYQQQPYYDGT